MCGTYPIYIFSLRDLRVGEIDAKNEDIKIWIRTIICLDKGGSADDLLQSCTDVIYLSFIFNIIRSNDTISGLGTAGACAWGGLQRPGEFHVLLDFSMIGIVCQDEDVSRKPNLWSGFLVEFCFGVVDGIVRSRVRRKIVEHFDLGWDVPESSIGLHVVYQYLVVYGCAIVTLEFLSFRAITCDVV